MLIRQHGNSTEIHAPAKVNFFLELLGRRDDGFHEIDTVMQTVSLWDHLVIRPIDTDGIRLTCRALHPLEQDSIPTDGRNLVVRACERIRDFAIQKRLSSKLSGLEIELRKWIPSAAGLGGASSDCAAALVGASVAWGLRLSQIELHTLAAELGSDVPFFLHGGAAQCTGRGEIIRPMNASAGSDLVIVKPPIALSTKTVFAKLVSDNSKRDSNPMCEAIQASNASQIASASFNRLERPAKQLTDQIDRLAGEFETVGCLGHQMSGSGSSYFGVFANHKSARNACRKLSSRLRDCRVFSVRTLAAIDRVVAFNSSANQTRICSA
jgi:4-diphosphocytidyl-2-C-methyl-D-erythritol kinase